MFEIVTNQSERVVLKFESPDRSLRALRSIEGKVGGLSIMVMGTYMYVNPCVKDANPKDIFGILNNEGFTEK